MRLSASETPPPDVPSPPYPLHLRGSSPTHTLLGEGSSPQHPLLPAASSLLSVMSPRCHQVGIIWLDSAECNLKKPPSPSCRVAGIHLGLSLPCGCPTMLNSGTLSASLSTQERMSKNGLSGPNLVWDPQIVGLLIMSVGPGWDGLVLSPIE